MSEPHTTAPSASIHEQRSTNHAPISVVILSGGRLEKLARCLECLAAGTRLPDEVVLVDKDPSGRTAQFLDRAELPFPLARIEGGDLGFAESRNRGVEAARGPLVAFLDDDCYADRYWLERLAVALEGADAVGGVVLPARDHRPPADFVPALNWTVGLSSTGLLSETGGMIELPSTSNLGLRKALWQDLPFQEIGGNLTRPDAAGNYRVGREDAQWWRGVRRCGFRTAIARRALVFHDIEPQRYGFARALGRAENDARAHWHREHPREELAAAAEDVAHYPARVARDLFAPGVSAAQARRAHGTWARRQWALLAAAVDDPNSDFSPTDRTALLARAGIRLVGDLAKPLVRGAAALAHHEFKRIRPLPSPASPPARLLVVSYNFLGDAVLTIPLLEQLDAAFPDAHLSVLCGPAAAPILRAVPAVDDVIELPGRLPKRDPRAVARVYRAVHDAEPDAIVVTYFHGAPPLGIFAATDAPVICWDQDHGMEQELWRDLGSAVVPKNMKKAEVAALLDLAAPLGVTTRPARPRWTPPAAARERIATLLERWGCEPGRFAVIPLDGVAGTWKVWPHERWAPVAWHLWEQHGLRVVFDGRRTARRTFEALGLSAEWAISSHGMLDTAELGALLAQARVCVGVDSGPQHLAHAVGTPTLTLFGPMDERRWDALPRLSADGDSPLPFAALRASDAPFEWLPHERLGLPADIWFQRLQPESVIGEVDRLLAGD
ncbi:MAG: glycosyltransferase [Candidatus Sumerlaeia bacterium]|nr:glycosyltransferase [Candidatus Sumerlaeia bacterium]